MSRIFRHFQHSNALLYHNRTIQQKGFSLTEYTQQQKPPNKQMADVQFTVKLTPLNNYDRNKTLLVTNFTRMRVISLMAQFKCA